MTARLLGTLLLACVGAGLGLHAAACQRRTADRLRLWERLWTYLEELLACRTLTGPMLLRCAAENPAFAELSLPVNGTLAALPLPGVPHALAAELRGSLAMLGGTDRAGARAELRRMAALCRRAADQQADRAAWAMTLWPRLGGCAGLLLSVLMW